MEPLICTILECINCNDLPSPEIPLYYLAQEYFLSLKFSLGGVGLLFDLDIQFYPRKTHISLKKP